jgi:hypothetical protein
MTPSARAQPVQINTPNHRTYRGDRGGRRQNLFNRQAGYVANEHSDSADPRKAVVRGARRGLTITLPFLRAGAHNRPAD